MNSYVFRLCCLSAIGCLMSQGQSLQPADSFRAVSPERPISFDSVRDAVIPQVVDGGGWQTTIILMNPGSRPLTAAIGFFGSTGQPLSIPFRHLNNQAHSFLSGPIAAGGSITIETSDIGATTVQGYALVAAADTSSLLTGVAIFRQRVSGRPDFEAVVPISPQDETEFAMPFDNSNGFSTGIALANPDESTAPNSVLTFRFLSSDGSSITSQVLTLAPGAHTAFSMPAQWPAVAGKSGMVIVTSTGRKLSALGLRFNPGGAFTSFHALSLPITATNQPPPPSSLPPSLPGVGSSCSSVMGLQIFAQDGTYLGRISTDRFASDSIANQYGRYGSSYASTSIFNRYGQYGSDYSSLSPFNLYASQPPVLVSGSNPVAFLSVNVAKLPRADTFAILNCVGRSR